MAALTRRDLCKVFWRSLWLQSSWSFEGMQSLGFAYAVSPALQRIHGKEEGSRLSRVRHLEFFNTHPFLAAAILGCVVRMEELGEGEETLSHAKTALMGAYGAVGDAFYLDAFPGAYCYVASRWEPRSGPVIVLLERHH